MEENKYPCAECDNEQKCKHSPKYLTCSEWRLWFHREWRKIREFFGVECVKSTLEEKE